ncbi:MAG: HEAT repeat domain-containing protein [Candidatus Hydrogenedentes bacterium]|nr:HEAT repeat domain-containing protein [Candidatus Hydrogenedentota bacterium]
MSVSTILGTAATAVAADEKSPLPAIKNYKFGDSREPLTAVADWVRGCLGDDKKRVEAAAELTAMLATDATYDCKQFVCRQLWLAAGPADVAAIAPLLRDAKTADMARYALERIADESVDKAFAEALGAVDDATKIGIVNSLGERRSPASVAAIAPLLSSADAKLAYSAVVALGKIGGADADKALVKGKIKKNPRVAEAVAQARLLIAESMAASGDAAGAAKILKALSSGGPKAVRAAAKSKREAK